MNLKINLKKIKEYSIFIFSTFIFFVYFYTPNIRFLPISLDKILLLWVVFWVFMKRRNTFIAITGDKKIFRIISLFFLIFTYTVGLDLIVMDGIKISYHVSLYLLQYIPFTICLYLFIDYFFPERVIQTTTKIILLILLIQSAIGWIMFVSPEIKYMIYGIQSSDPANLYKGLILRGNGFSSGLAFSIPLLHGIILGLVLLYILENPKLSSFVYFLFCLLIAVANARIALIPIILLLPFVLLKIISSVKLSTILKFFFGLGFTFYGFYILSINSEYFAENIENLQKVVDWVSGGYMNLFGLDQGSNKENITSILSDQITFNTDLIPLIFGEGINAFQSLSNQSDIGLINLFAFGGILYFISTHFVTYYSLYCGYNNTSNKWLKYLIVFIIICYFAASLKGVVFTEQILGRFLIFACLFAYLDGINIKSKSI